MNVLAENLLFMLARTTTILAVAALFTGGLLLATRARSPKVHRIAWCLVLVQGWLFCRLPVEIPYYDATAVAPEPVALGVLEDPVSPEVSSVPSTSTPELPETSPVSSQKAAMPSLAMASTLAATPTESEAGPRQPSRSAVSADTGQARRPTYPPQNVTAADTDSLLWTTVMAIWPLAVVIVWLLGMAVLATGGTVRYIRFVHRLPPGEPAEDEWNQQWHELLARRSVRRSIPLRMTSHLGPMLCRLPGGYQLLLPVGLWRSLSPAARLDILCHELAHFQRGDTWKSLSVRLLALPHWFNPFAWWAVRRFDEAAEWACDQQAADAEPEHKPDYVRALLQLGSQSTAEPAYSRAARGRELRVRVRRLLAHHPLEDSVMKKLAVIAVAVVLAVVFLIRFDLVAQNPTSETPTPSEAKPQPRGDLDAYLRVAEDVRARRPKASVSDSKASSAASPAPASGGTPGTSESTEEPLEKTPATAETLPSKAIKLRFQFRYQRWEDVLKWFAETTHTTLIAQTLPSGTFNYSDDREYTPAEAIELFNNVLVEKGFVLVRRGQSLVLVKVQESAAKQKAAPAPEREVLRYDGRSFGEWKAELRTELKPERRVEAIKAFTAFAAHGYGKEATQAIVEVMRQYDVWSIRKGTPIGQLKQAAIDAFKPRAADDPDWDSIDPADALPVLLDELAHGNANGRLFASRALETMGTESEVAIRALVAVIQADRDPRVRQLASGALAHVDQKGDAIASVVRHLSANRDGAVLTFLLLTLVPGKQFEATQTIFHYDSYDSGSSYGMGGPGMASSGFGGMSMPGGGMMGSTEMMGFEEMKSMGMGGYGEMGSASPPVLTERGKVVLKALIEVLDQDDPSVRTVVLGALARMGPLAADAVPKLLKVFDRAETEHQTVIAGTLGSIGPKAKEAIPRIIELFGQVEGRRRATVAYALAQFGPLAKEATPVLLKALEDKDKAVRAAVRRVLARMGVGGQWGAGGGYDGYGIEGAMGGYETDGAHGRPGQDSSKP